MSGNRGTEFARTNTPEAFTRADGTEKLQFKIGGLSCSFCVASITKALGRMDGVRELTVNLAHEEALVEYEPAKVSAAQLKQTLVDLGYTVRDPNRVPTFEEEEAELRRERNKLLVAAGLAAFALVGAMSTWMRVPIGGLPWLREKGPCRPSWSIAKAQERQKRRVANPSGKQKVSAGRIRAAGHRMAAFCWAEEGFSWAITLAKGFAGSGEHLEGPPRHLVCSRVGLMLS